MFKMANGLQKFLLKSQSMTENSQFTLLLTQLQGWTIFPTSAPHSALVFLKPPMF